MPTEFSSTNLPLNSQLTISFLSVDESIQLHGPYGLGYEVTTHPPVNPKDRTIRQWHCTLTFLSVCPCCKARKDHLWFKGHGLTLDAALGEVFTQVNNPPEGGWR